MRTVRKCRVCGTNLPNPYLNLGKTPLANSYIKSEEIPREQGYELAVALCQNCKLSQLTAVVPPNLMFKHYLYVSSITRTFRKHCDDLAASALGALRDYPIAPTVLDIGSNDGCLLSYFRERGARVIGVDPAENLAAEANACGIQTICAFWGSAAAEEVFRLVGQPAIITATNVLAHVDALNDFLTCVESILPDAGLFIFEVPYLVDLMQKCEFDTIYHEHLSYFLVRPVQYAVEAHGLKIVDIQHRPIHGGTIRVAVAKQTSSYCESTTVAQFLATERALRFYDNASYKSFANTVERNKRKMLELLAQLASEGKRIAGYGAAAKGNTLLNYYGIGHESIKYICDDNPKKHHYLTPGTHIPIVNPSYISTDPCDYLLLLAWNFSDEIMRRTHGFRRSGGKYILPVPTPSIH